MWIKNAKSLIRAVLRNCSYSKRMNTKSKPPLMGELPKTGIDYFGPLTIKLNKQTRKTCATAKRYGAVFTCLTTQTVYLELIGIYQLILLYLDSEDYWWNELYWWRKRATRGNFGVKSKQNLQRTCCKTN